MAMADSSPRFAELHARYAASLPAKRRALDAAWQAFASAPDEGTFRELQLAVHRLAGSARAYGYVSLGARAQAADALLIRETVPMRDPGAFVQQIAEPVRVLLEGLASAAEAGSGRTL